MSKEYTIKLNEEDIKILEDWYDTAELDREEDNDCDYDLILRIREAIRMENMNEEKKYKYKIDESYKQELKVDFSLGRYPIFYKNGEQSYATFLIGEDGHLYFSDIKNLVSAKNAYKNYKLGSLIFIKYLKNKIFNLLKMRNNNA